ncbi:MAG: class E sortase [Actinobacteria bacterium]|nr:class E sortase [Actinomycetota bacterium]
MLFTLGLVILGFLAYMYWGTAIRADSAQHNYRRELSTQWASVSPLAALTPPDLLAPGTPFAMLRIPQLGPSWQFAVVQGTGVAQLALAPGHVPGTAAPGQVGNFAIAGYRITAGNPFWRLPSLHRGSVIKVETINGTYEYDVTSSPVSVPADDLAVLAPVPFHPGVQSDRRMITLITCDPAWTGSRRVIVTGILLRTLPRPLGS